MTVQNGSVFRKQNNFLQDTLKYHFFIEADG